MKIRKIFNNNAVATISDDKKDIILTGSGIGFQKKIGDIVDESKIEKTYYCQGGEQNPIYKLFLSTPSEYFKISHSIMEKVCTELGIELKDQFIISLTDHLVFAVDRAKTGIELPNLVLPEIKTMYRKEYEIGLWGIALIEDTLKIKVSKDEAGYIALHILDGYSEYDKCSALEILQIVNESINFIQENLNFTFDENGLDYNRLMTHLKFMARHILHNDEDDIGIYDEEMYDFVRSRNINISRCVDDLGIYIKNNYKYELLKKEKLYLMIHLKKCIDKDCY